MVVSSKLLSNPSRVNTGQGGPSYFYKIPQQKGVFDFFKALDCVYSTMHCVGISEKIGLQRLIPTFSPTNPACLWTHRSSFHKQGEGLLGWGGAALWIVGWIYNWVYARDVPNFKNM